MGVLVPRHQSILAKIDICLVLCGCLIFLSSWGCDARTFVPEISVPSVADLKIDSLKKSPVEVAQPDGLLKSAEHVDEITQRKLQPTSEFAGKSDKVNADVKLRGVTGTHDTEHHKKVRVEETVDSTLKELHNKQAHKEEQRAYKRLLKTPIRRLKRDIVDEPTLSIDGTITQFVEDKASELDDDLGKDKGVNVEGIRRLDINVEEENKKENEKVSEIGVKTESRNIEKLLSTESKIEDVDSSKIVESVAPEIIEKAQINDETPKSIGIQENPIEPLDLNKNSESIPEALLKSSVDNSNQNVNPKTITSRTDHLQLLKSQALEFQEKIRDKVFLQTLKDQTSEILPNIPQFTENQFLDILKTAVIKKNVQYSSDIDNELLKDSSLNNNQKEIIQYAKQFVAPTERQSFFENMSECIRGLDILNCMRIFIYPIIAENMPEAITQNLPHFPIEINVGDIFQGNRAEKQKLGRQVPIAGFYSNQIDPDSMIFDILMEGLLKNPPNENLPSYITAKNETLSKILTCNRFQLLQMTEKFLPEAFRKVYSDQMLSCVQRFEYFSCIKYFSWPEIRKYYPALPPFPLGDDFLTSLTYPGYPLITYPGSETGFVQLPEVIESGPRHRPEAVIISILRQTLNDQLRFPTLPTPIHLDLILRSPGISQEQILSIHIAEQLLPVALRSMYVSKTVECMRQFGYYNCMKYGTWPTLRQWNPSLPEFPTFQGTDTSTSRQTDQRSVSFLNSQSQEKSSAVISQNNRSIFLKRSKRNVDDLLDSYSHNIPNDKKNSVPRRIPPQLNFPNLTETELLEILVYLSKHKNSPDLEKGENKFGKYFVDSLNDTEKALITADQYEILKLVQSLSTETAKANFMSQLFRCITSLSFIRCVGIFVWPVIVNNFPTPFRLPLNRGSRVKEDMQIEEILGMSPSEFETELVNRKEQIESNFIQWYKSLTGEKFEANVGPLKVKGHGDGDLTVTFSGFREGRLSKIKDNKSLPSILTIISDVIEEVFDTKPEKVKNKKESPKKEKRNRSLHSFEESNLQELLRHKTEENNSKRLAKDDLIINMLLEKLKPSVGDIKDTEVKHYFDIENAYRAFQMLFGPKVSDKITNGLKFMSDKNHINQHEYDELKAIDELELVSLEAQEKNLEGKLKISKPRGRAIYEFEDDVNGTSTSRKELQIKERLSKFKSCLADYIQKFYSLSKKKVQTGLTLRLPRLNDKIVGRRMSSSLSTLSRDVKSKVGQMMPAVGIAASFLAHIALAHAKAVASVAGLLSNMALGSAMLGLVRDMILGSNTEPKVKYVYENEKHDTGISWSTANSNPTISYTPPSKIQGPAPYFSDIY